VKPALLNEDAAVVDYGTRAIGDFYAGVAHDHAEFGVGDRAAGSEIDADTWRQGLARDRAAVLDGRPWLRRVSVDGVVIIRFEIVTRRSMTTGLV
jgi:hypothetical protein